MSLEEDENYVPRTRSDFGLPPAGQAHITDYHDIFEETPIYSLLRLLVMQAVGLQAYLMVNALGSPKYPAGTNVSSTPNEFASDQLILTSISIPPPPSSSNTSAKESWLQILLSASWYYFSLNSQVVLVREPF
jgi:hypothetical protein